MPDLAERAERADFTAPAASTTTTAPTSTTTAATPTYTTTAAATPTSAAADGEGRTAAASPVPTPAAAAAATAAADVAVDSSATDCLVGLLGAFLELNHLEPELMQVGKREGGGEAGRREGVCGCVVRAASNWPPPHKHCRHGHHVPSFPSSECCES